MAAIPRPDRRVLLGILLMCAAGMLFPVMNGLVQVLSRTYPSEQVIWARNTGHLLIVLAVVVPRFGPAVLRTVRPAAQIIRSTVLLMSTAMFFFGVKHLPLAVAGSISQMTPFFVTLLAWPILGERIRPARLVAVLVGFLGVLVVIRPGTDVFHWASLLVVGSAACYAIYQVFTRRVAGLDRPETSVMYSALVGTLVMSAVVPFAWKTPESLLDAAMLCCLGALGASGHYCVARALTYAQANIVAPFQYWQIIGSVVVGYAVSGLMPDLGTWIGAGIIVCAGVFIVLTATRGPRLG
jgi:drug/metabolite transporter (DMT)-like permease